MQIPSPCTPATTNTCAGPRETYEQIKQKLTATHFYGPNSLLKLLDAKWDADEYKVKDKKREIKPVVVGGGTLFCMLYTVHLFIILFHKRDWRTTYGNRVCFFGT